jgi:hypothetical protein
MQKNHEANKIATETPGKIRCRNLKIFKGQLCLVTG